jgi:hydroxylamine reductase (hybrid-cluster protein)
MFCYQCEETARGTGCMTKGVCGRDGGGEKQLSNSLSR